MEQCHHSFDPKPSGIHYSQSPTRLMQHTASEAVSNHAGVVVEAGQDPQVVEPHAVQDHGH
jgi:hypothetical protein